MKSSTNEQTQLLHQIVVHPSDTVHQKSALAHHHITPPFDHSLCLSQPLRLLLGVQGQVLVLLLVEGGVGIVRR